MAATQQPVSVGENDHLPIAPNNTTEPSVSKQASGVGGTQPQFTIPDFLLDTNSEYYDLNPLDESSLKMNPSPINPFSHAFRARDRMLGKIADWAPHSSNAQPGRQTTAVSRKGMVEATADDEYNDDWSLVMMEPKYPSSTVGGRRNVPRYPHPNTKRSMGRRPSASKNVYRLPKEPSIIAGSDWTLLDEIEFGRLSKLQYAPVTDPEIKLEIEKIRPYDKTLDRLSVKNERQLGNLDINPTPINCAKDDLDLLRLAKEAGALIATTDVVITALMACSRSILPWDIVISRVDGIIVLDKRPSSTHLDFPAINENADEPPMHDKEHINGSGNLAVEAARINAKIPAFVADSTIPSDNTSNTLYRFVLWDLGDDLKMLVKCQVNYYDSTKDSYGVIRSLLEYEPGRVGDWRSRLDTQRAAIVASEAKNNAALLSRWLLGTILADVNLFKIAFISRVTPKDRTKHALLGLFEAEPYGAAYQLGVDVANGFGILKALCKQISDLLPSGGKELLVLMKDPNKPLIRLFSCPAGTQLN
jgi:translation initiation factor 3 subunit D